MKRWLGVTLYYDKAWWDKDEQTWVDENFHILEQVTLYDQERRLKRLRSSNSEPPLSSFAWNEVVFRSFKSGYLKAIDFGVFRQLKFAAAKRMYRFLDKRFYHKSRWEFDLVEFAFEHIGLSRNYDTGQLKRRLQAAITELESVGFPRSTADIAALRKNLHAANGESCSCENQCRKIEPASQESAGLAKQLVERGVTPSVANDLVRDYPKELIEMQMEVLDRLQKEKERESIRNPAGYLVKSLRDGYVPAGASVAEAITSCSCRDPQAGNSAATRSRSGTDPCFNSYLLSLGKLELDELERAALQHVEPTLVAGYERSEETHRRSSFFSVYRRNGFQEREARPRILFSNP